MQNLLLIGCCKGILFLSYHVFMENSKPWKTVKTFAQHEQELINYQISTFIEKHVEFLEKFKLDSKTSNRVVCRDRNQRGLRTTYKNVSDTKRQTLSQLPHGIRTRPNKL